MNGKHGKNRNPLHKFRDTLNTTPRIMGAVVGLAAFGVIAGTAQAGVFDSESAQSAAAVATVPGGKADGGEPGRTSSHRGKADRKKSDSTTSESRASESRTTDSKSKRDRVIELAKSWRPGTDERVRYSQTNSYQGYRTDCSGYVAMTLGLAKPGPNTVGLTSSRYTERITMSELKKGDLVMDAQGTNTTRHVVIFEKWANDDHTSYWAYEQRGRYGTDYRTRDYGLNAGSEYKAYRPKNL
ncbi:hypothetical protein [Actinomadura decatromicini]|uniref:NlpC/P60 family protein n=1 Tax=Actinomadura decatromicini TaxID=2604572 RepID=A0A5D3FFW9_9ACTN|nr:hypothetical protein [Actinomadura decatromicini]TYK46872.1 hypothetical protein FXF68_23875 [Actinomadura decatromicini]